jgi:hypothetical protein
MLALIVDPVVPYAGSRFRQRQDFHLRPPSGTEIGGSLALIDWYHVPIPPSAPRHIAERKFDPSALNIPMLEFFCEVLTRRRRVAGTRAGAGRGVSLGTLTIMRLSTASTSEASSWCKMLSGFQPWMVHPISSHPASSPSPSVESRPISLPASPFALGRISAIHPSLAMPPVPLQKRPV